MTNNIPSEIREKIKVIVYDQANEYDYLNRTRPENSAFMDRLVRDPRVGGVIREYRNDNDVKTYIKDAILNHYSKEKRSLSRNISSAVPTIHGGRITEVSYNKGNNISIHKAVESSKLFVVARSSYLKWETGVRKLALHVAGNAVLMSNNDITLILVIFLHDCIINDSDKKLVEDALKVLDVSCSWIS